MRAGMLDAAGAGYALYRGLQAPLSIAGQFETALLDIAQKAELSDAAMKALGARIRALAPMVNQTSQEVAAGMDVLLGMGLDPKRAEGILPVLGKTATAYRAAIDDLAKTGMAAIDNLKLKVEEMPKAMDMLAAAGKAGAFELKDMAQHLPALSAMAETNGMRGLSAILELGTALQIVRKGAGDSAQAATNLQNVLQKLTSPDVVGKFKKVAGVDLKKAVEAAVKGGMSPIEAIADITNGVIKKSKGKIKIGDLFGDLQMQLGMAALVNHLEEWRRIRAEVSQASGVVDADFERRMKTSAERTKAFTIRLREMGLTIGNILIPSMNGLMDSLSPMLRSIESLCGSKPGACGRRDQTRRRAHRAARGGHRRALRVPVSERRRARYARHNAGRGCGRAEAGRRPQGAWSSSRRSAPHGHRRRRRDPRCRRDADLSELGGARRLLPVVRILVHGRVGSDRGSRHAPGRRRQAPLGHVQRILWRDQPGALARVG